MSITDHHTVNKFQILLTMLIPILKSSLLNSEQFDYISTAILQIYVEVAET